MSALPGFTSEPVWELQRADGLLLAGEREFRGKRFFELRLWAGESCDTPTKKGVTFPPDQVRALATALIRYCDEMDAAALEEAA